MRVCSLFFHFFVPFFLTLGAKRPVRLNYFHSTLVLQKLSLIRFVMYWSIATVIKAKLNKVQALII